MENRKRLLALTAALLTVAAASCSSKKSSSEDTAPTTKPVTTTDIKDLNQLKKTTKGSNPDMTINWLADYDLNPVENSERSAALAIFEDYYGGQINYISTSADDRLTKLEEMVMSGAEVDMFPYDVSAVPGGVMKNLYAPLDDYFDLLETDTELWSDMQDEIEMFSYDGGHYVLPYSVSNPLILTYSRKMVTDEGLDDPYKLYQSGKWNWDTFMQLMEKFKEKTPEGQTRYGICGSFGEALLNSTGCTVINYSSGSFTNNITDKEIEKAELLMQDIVQKQLYSSAVTTYFPTDGSALFYAMGDWSLGESNAQNQEMDLMAVPFPKAPDASAYYLTCDYNARMLVRNSAHGEAVASYIKCERLAATEPKFIEAAKQKATAEVRTVPTGFLRSVVTPEQYDAIQSYLTSPDTKPIFDFGYGIGDSMNSYGYYTFETRGAMNNIAEAILRGETDSWETLRTSMSGIITKVIANYNKKGTP